MAPPLAALAGIGLVRSCEFYLRGGWRALLLPGCLLLTAAWQLYIEASAMGWRLGEYHPLHLALMGGTLLSAGVLLVILASRPLGPLGQAGPSARALAAGAVTTRLAAPIIISFGHPVMAMGGFHGLDPILTPATLARMVEAKQIRFVMVGDAPFISRRLGADVAARPITDWVQERGQLVDPALWR